MSAFYDLASLVVVPSGYKSGKVYAQKPLTTDGQLTFTRASTATRVNASGLIEEVATGVPRLDYLGSTCPRLLLEPQRTNDITFSEQINNAAWANVRGVVTANSTISPSGYQDADTFASAAAQAFPPALTRNPTYAGNTNYTLSVFAKVLGNTNVFAMTYVDNLTGFTGGGANFNLATQVVTIAQSPNASVTASMQDYGNGWYRLTLGFLTIATPTFNYFQIGQTTNDVANGFALWGAQLEAGAYATSYIPTLGASVTRVADAASKTGISSLIGQTEGTSFLDFQFNGTQECIIMDIAATGLTPQNRIILYNSGNNTINLVIFTANVQQVSILSSSYSVGQRIKVGVGYKLNDFAFYINGVQIGTDNSGTVPATSRVDIGNRQDAGFPSPISVNQTLLFKTRLTNAQLAELTA
jgi:hypothetical protein